jgi:hypothetical protein
MHAAYLYMIAQQHVPDMPSGTPAVQRAQQKSTSRRPRVMSRLARSISRAIADSKSKPALGTGHDPI